MNLAAAQNNIRQAFPACRIFSKEEELLTLFFWLL